MLDLLQHVFIQQIVGREKILQKQLIELIDLNQQIGVIEKTRYCIFVFVPIYSITCQYILYLSHVRSCVSGVFTPQSLL